MALSRSLPGGKVEDGETVAGALVREMREETGLEVEPGRLLYVCDHLPGDGTTWFTSPSRPAASAGSPGR